jgi:hypothetical protein
MFTCVCTLYNLLRAVILTAAIIELLRLQENPVTLGSGPRKLRATTKYGYIPEGVLFSGELCYLKVNLL